jgi:hypothetical protein
MVHCAEAADQGSGLSLGPDIFHWTNSLVWLNRGSKEQRCICSGCNGAEFKWSQVKVDELWDSFHFNFMRGTVRFLISLRYIAIKFNLTNDN